LELHSTYKPRRRVNGFVYIPGSVQDAGDLGRNLHWSEDWDSPAYSAIDRDRRKERENETKRKTDE